MNEDITYEIQAFCQECFKIGNSAEWLNIVHFNTRLEEAVGLLYEHFKKIDIITADEVIEEMEDEGVTFSDCCFVKTRKTLPAKVKYVRHILSCLDVALEEFEELTKHKRTTDQIS